jgi:hypothetical protein
MKTKIIDGKECQLREVIYSDFGAQTPTEKLVAEIKSSDLYKTEEGRAEVFQDRSYSWTKDSNPYIYEGEEDEVDRAYSEREDDELDSLYADNKGSESESGLESEDRTYSAGSLNMRMIFIKRPLHVQLRDLYREHTRFYKAKANKLKPNEMDLLIQDFRFELHRIIALAKEKVTEQGGNMDTVLKVTSLGGGPDLTKTLRKLTILFKRVEQAYEKFGYIPKTFQVRLNDSLSILVSHFILDVYGEELEKRKLGDSGLSKDQDVTINKTK